MDLSLLPDWVLWYAVLSPLVVAVVALVGVFFTNWRTTVNIEKAAAAARESKRLERHEDRISDSYIRIEIARAALQRVLSDTVYDQRPGAFRQEVPATHEDIRERLQAMVDAHAEGSLYVTAAVDRYVGRLRPLVNEAARVVELFNGSHDEERVGVVLTKVQAAIHASIRLRIQMRIEIGSVEDGEREKYEYELAE